MNIVLDIAVIAIILLLVFGGYRNGIIKTVAELLSTVIASLISSFLGSTITERLYASFLRDTIVNIINDALPDYSAIMRTNDITKSLMNDSPEFVKNALEMSGIDSKQLNEKVAQLARTDIPMQLESMVRPVILKMLTVLVTVILFIICAIIISFAARALTKTVDITGLSTMNKVLGALIGMVEAVILLMILSMVIYMLTIMLPVDMAQNLRDNIDSTYIYKLIFYIDYPDTIIDSLLNIKNM